MKFAATCFVFTLLLSGSFSAKEDEIRVELIGGDVIGAPGRKLFPYSGYELDGGPNQNKVDEDDPDFDRNVTQLIQSKGYPVEEHTVQTKDGYLLAVQRIPHGRSGHGYRDQKPVVFLQHGLLSSSSDFVINFPHQSLGFVLADLGFDVWLGNTRGNEYNHRHIKYNDTQKEFWNFSFDEMAEYDLPAMIDYALNQTGQQQLFYVGHSQGTTAAFALLSESPEYNKKIKLYIAMAPVATVGYMTSAVKYLAPFADDIDFLLKLIGVKDFLPSDALTRWLSRIFCEHSKIRVWCEKVMFLVMGDDEAQMNMTRLGVYASHFPAGSSSKSLVHFAQLINSKTFCKFDYGKKENQERYNQTTPPLYNMTEITTPVALLWADNDALADPKDVQVLVSRLRKETLVSSYEVPFPPFNHCDFVYAIDAPTLINNQVIGLLQKYYDML